MQKYPALLTLALLYCLFSAPLYGAEKEGDSSSMPAERLGRGIINIVTSPLEVPSNMIKRAQYREETTDNPFAVMGGFIAGGAIGVVRFPWRLAAGLYDVVTCPVSSCNESIISPEHITFSNETDY